MSDPEELDRAKDRAAASGEEEFKTAWLTLSPSGAAPSVGARLAGEPGIDLGREPAPIPSEGPRYIPLGTLGKGGMGEVIRAADRDLRREVAIKTLLAPQDHHQVLRFIEEAQVTGQLEHPNIVPVHELGLGADGRTPYLVMKRVRGRNLGDVLEAVRQGTEPPAPPGAVLSRLLDVFVKVADAMAYAHSRGVIHRDLKPPNIMVGEFGEVLVMDWGLAKVLGRSGLGGEGSVTTARSEASDPGTGTLEGTIAGTPAYMPPEQARGDIEELDERSDVYSLGALLYEILALVPPFRRQSTSEVLEAVRRGEIAPPSRRSRASWTIPRDLEAVVLRAMAPEKADRYPSVLDLRAELERYQTGRTLEAAEYSLLEVGLKWARRNRAAVGTGLAAALLLLSSIAIFIVYLTRAWSATNEERDAALAARAAERQAAEEARAGREEATRLAELAEERSLTSERFRAEGSVREADALLLAGQPGQAETRYREAWWILESIEMPNWAAAWGLLDLYRRYPPPLLCLRGMEGGAYLAAFSPDERALLTASPGSRRIHLWDALTGAPLATLEAPGGVHAVAFLPDSMRALSGSEGGALIVWDLARRKALRTIPTQAEVVASLAISSDGRRAATAGGAAAPVEIWDVETGARVGEASGATALAFGPGGTELITGMGSSIVILDVERALPGEEWTLQGESIASLAIDPDGRRILAGSLAGALGLWDREAGAQAFFHGRQAQLAVAFSPDGDYALSGGGDRFVTIWQTRAFIKTFDGETRVLSGHLDAVRSVSSSSTGDRILSAGGEALVWDARHDSEVLTIRTRGEGVQALAFSPDGRLLASAGENLVELWDVAAGAALLSFPGGGEVLAFSPDGRCLASSGDRIRVWNLDRGEEVRSIEGTASGLVFLPEGERLLSAERTKLVLRDLATGREIAVFSRGEEDASALALSADGCRALSGGARGDLVLWQLDGALPPRILKGHSGAVRSVAWLTDGGLALSHGDDGTIRRWEVDTGNGREWIHYSGETAPSRVAFSARGGLAVLHPSIWNVELRQILPEGNMTRNLALDEEVEALAVSPDGAAIAIAFADRVQILDSSRALRHREFAERLDRARALLDMDSADGEALAAYGEWYAFRGRWDLAVNAFERARERGVTTGGIDLARAYAKVGRPGAAMRELDLVRSRPVPDESFARHLALLGRALGEDRRRRMEARPRLAAEAADLTSPRVDGELRKGAPTFGGRIVSWYRFDGKAGRRVRLALSSPAFTSRLLVIDPSGDQLSGESVGSGALYQGVLPEDGAYVVGCSSRAEGKTGAYSLEFSLD